MTHATSKTESGNGSENIVRHAARSSLRLRLLSGAASLALPVASMIAAASVCVSGAAHAQTTVNPVQTTTFTLNPAQNPITFGSTTNIDTTSSSSSHAVAGGTGTAWTVTNQGRIAGARAGISLDGAGSSVVNSNTIISTVNVIGGGGVVLNNGGTVANQANATITAVLDGVSIQGAAGSVTNAGTIISSSATGVFLQPGGDVTNLAGGRISGDVFGVLANGPAGGTVINAGTIEGKRSDSSGVSGSFRFLTNQTGGTISGAHDGVTLGSATITNEQGATITGGANGISASGTVANAGTIEATAANGNAISTGNITITSNTGAIQATNAGGRGIFAGGTATVTNNTGTIKGAAGGIIADTVNVTANAGTISGNTGVFATGTAKVNNLSGGTITGNTTGIQAGTLDVTNAAGGTISGASDAGIVGAGTVTNAGTISGGTASVRFTGAGTNVLTLQTGSKLIGDAVGSVGATNKLIINGRVGADNNFLNFNSLDVSGGVTLNGVSTVGTVTVGNNTSLAVGDGGHQSAVLTGNVTINSGGALSGLGKIGGDINVMSGGRLAPGFSTGVFTASGNVNFSDNSTFVINANSDGTASKLVVGKKATLAGSVQVLASGTFAPSLEKKYTILTAASLSGTFAGGITTDLAFLKPTLTYTNTDVTLTLCNNTTSGCAGGGGAVGGTGGSLFGFANAAQTRNQNTVATALDGGPQSNRLVSAVLVQTVDGARQAFDALSGEVYGSVHNAQAEEAQFARGAMLGRMRQASYAGAPGELGALGFAGPQLAYASDSATAAQASAYPVKAPYGPSRDLTFWSLGLGGWGHSDGDGNAASLKSRFGGFLSGVDARFGESWRAGFTAGYVRTDLHANDRASSAGIDSVQLGAYATGRLGVFNVRGGGSYSFDDIDASRSIFFPGFTDQTKARLHGNVGQVFGEVGYGMALGNFALEPLAGLAYVHLRNGSFNESGGAAALTGSATHENLGYSSLGLRLASIMPLSNGTVLVPRATVAWQYAFGDVTPSAALAFQGTGTAFSVAGVPVARNSALVEGGFDWRFTPQAKLGVSYLGELAANAQTHAIKGAFTWDF
jgi:outer membrane autotransporter protein